MLLNGKLVVDAMNYWPASDGVLEPFKDGALTAAELAAGSGRDLMLGVAIGYTVQSRFVGHGDFMTRGFDHTAQLAFSHNATAGRLLGMTEPQIANAIAMAASSDASFAVIRAEPLSQWKGLASAQSALGAMNTLFLARRAGRCKVPPDRSPVSWAPKLSPSNVTSTMATIGARQSRHAAPSRTGSSGVILREWKLIIRPGCYQSPGQCEHCRSRSSSWIRPARGSTTRTSATV
jgi:hypothetical protein